MIVCSCNVLSDRDVRECLEPGPGCPYTPAQVYRCLGCSPQCGRCARTIRDIMDSALPDVHSSCTTRCNSVCPLRTECGVETVETIEVLETESGLEIRETVEIREYVRA